MLQFYFMSVLQYFLACEANFNSAMIMMYLHLERFNKQDMCSILRAPHQDRVTLSHMLTEALALNTAAHDLTTYHQSQFALMWTPRGVH